MATKDQSQPAAAPPTSATSSVLAERVEYRPNPKVHLAQAGKVALSNWVGRIGDRRVRVYRGAQAAKIPESVQKAMAESGVGIGVITLAELGLRSLPGEEPTLRGARVVGVTEG